MEDNEVITGTLEQWRVEPFGDSGEYVIYGDVYGDVKERFRDGYYIHTAGIDKKTYPISKLKEGGVVRTRNSIYKLGKAL